MYANGLGVDTDNVKACVWLRIAETNGHDAAKKPRKMIEKNMTRAEEKKAKKLAKEWLKEFSTGPVTREQERYRSDKLNSFDYPFYYQMQMEKLRNMKPIFPPEQPRGFR
jgi:TPR repeat protein